MLAPEQNDPHGGLRCQEGVLTCPGDLEIAGRKQAEAALGESKELMQLFIEHAPAALKAGLDVWGDVGPALAIMRRLKSEMDPRGTLNPGRYVGGI